jgi:hypothetical protein
VIAHVFGVVVGGGAALVGDGVFLASARDGRLSKTELKFIRLTSAMVWTGLLLITITGLGIFALDVEKYSASAKFLAKMTIVGVLIANGILFHLSHIPRMLRHTGEFFTSSDEFMRKRSIMLASGAVSGSSWISAFILGSLHKVPYSYGVIMASYLVIVAVALVVSFAGNSRLIPKK